MVELPTGMCISWAVREGGLDFDVRVSDAFPRSLSGPHAVPGRDGCRACRPVWFGRRSHGGLANAGSIHMAGPQKPAPGKPGKPGK